MEFSEIELITKVQLLYIYTHQEMGHIYQAVFCCGSIYVCFLQIFYTY